MKTTVTMSHALDKIFRGSQVAKNSKGSVENILHLDFTQ